MAKKRKQYEPKYRDALDNSVYVFHNQIFNFDLFINACDMQKMQWNSLTRCAIC